MKRIKLTYGVFLSLLAFVFLISCTQTSKEGKKFTVLIDGSSTVFPITESIAEEYQKTDLSVRVGIGVSGTGGGFRKFIESRIHINSASRRIKDEEKKALSDRGLKYLELPVAYDGLSVVVHKKNDWVDYLSLKELHKIWKPNSKIQSWSDIRPHWPSEKMDLYGPGSDSGTFDYFTKKVNKRSGVSRSDYTKSEDDHILVLGVKGDKNSLGYFGFSYYINNKFNLKAVPIKTGKNKPVSPTFETIQSGEYKPFSRKLFIYIHHKAIREKAVQDFLNFYMKKAPKIVKGTGYIPLREEEYRENLNKMKRFLSSN